MDLLRRQMNMTIKREELDRREVDFPDMASGRRLPPVHPGEILRDEFLTPWRSACTDLPKRSRFRVRD